MTAPRPLPASEQLPHALYRAEQVRELDRVAIERFGIASELLMERAGTFAFNTLQEYWPDCRHITVLSGAGNNAGDGYVVARLACEAGYSVTLVEAVDHATLKGDAALNAARCRKLDIRFAESIDMHSDPGVIVDGLLGTGLDRPLTGHWAQLVEQVNASRAPVLSLDIPSGLHADSGAIMGCVIRADVTTAFIGLKQGLFTGEGPACCGEVLFTALEVPARVYATQILSARRIDWHRQQLLLAPLSPTAHKGSQGHVLVVGGDHGMAGAPRLAAEAALRTGAGLVSVATRSGHQQGIVGLRPELMVHAVDKADDLGPYLARASAVVIGPGLGQDAWGMVLLKQVLKSDLPLVVDADGLNLLASQAYSRGNWVLTPHPGEAARLLDMSIDTVQADRFAAVAALQQRYGGTIVLKGAGSLVASGAQRPPAVCSQGNPGMATAGMGDVLSGVIGSLLAQGYAPEMAAETGCSLHAAAADLAANDGMRGMIASDLYDAMRHLLG